MFFLIKNAISKDLFNVARNEIINNKKMFREDYNKYAGEKIYKIDHHKLIHMNTTIYKYVLHIVFFF